ncbi:hypothetical protein MS2017_1200 [Bathymodiolus thermophilus thioautotrophic gill symbiont]|uniref:Uncharacterized protein n=2 Tax=Bathymodiolus thermophilus thioautotrophic gill symbiont TaxID=2360 RepID=A0A3G3IMD9_9GAMM|nr:hypothetical protein MS2017_1200 [Bathymodiolus thermophilus thioautotrophic gill symbiont]
MKKNKITLSQSKTHTNIIFLWNNLELTHYPKPMNILHYNRTQNEHKTLKFTPTEQANSAHHPHATASTTVNFNGIYSMPLSFAIT